MTTDRGFEPLSLDRLTEMEPYLVVAVGDYEFRSSGVTRSGEPLLLPSGESAGSLLEASLERQKGKRTSLRFKLIDYGRAYYDSPWFPPSSRVRLWYGYTQDFQEIGPFRIDKISPSWSGPSIILEIEALCGNDIGDRHARRVYGGLTVVDLFERVATAMGLRFDARNVDRQGTDWVISDIRPVVQRGENYGAFLARVAEEYGCDFTIDGETAYLSGADFDAAARQVRYTFDRSDASMVDPVVEIKTYGAGGTRRARAPREEVQDVMCPEVQQACDCSAFGPQIEASIQSATAAALAASQGSFASTDEMLAFEERLQQEIRRAVSPPVSQPGSSLPPVEDQLNPTQVGGILGAVEQRVSSAVGGVIATIPESVRSDVSSMIDEMVGPEMAALLRGAGAGTEITSSVAAFENIGSLGTVGMGINGDLRLTSINPALVTSLDPTSINYGALGISEEDAQQLQSLTSTGLSTNTSVSTAATPGAVDSSDVEAQAEAERRRAASRRRTKYTLKFRSILGNPTIDLLDRVAIRGVGSLIDGDNYEVTRVYHSITSSGYYTDIECSRVVTSEVRATRNPAASPEAALIEEGRQEWRLGPEYATLVSSDQFTNSNIDQFGSGLDIYGPTPRPQETVRVSIDGTVTSNTTGERVTTIRPGGR
jgi:phage protein D